MHQKFLAFIFEQIPVISFLKYSIDKYCRLSLYLSAYETSEAFLHVTGTETIAVFLSDDWNLKRRIG